MAGTEEFRLFGVLDRDCGADDLCSGMDIRWAVLVSSFDNEEDRLVSSAESGREDLELKFKCAARFSPWPLNDVDPRNCFGDSRVGSACKDFARVVISASRFDVISHIRVFIVVKFDF